ncbi:MAG TPA: phospholipase D family protein [Gemmataceae bacterium]|nr:phospholipase D family protein [Gemmataceae bacterium]
MNMMWIYIATGFTGAWTLLFLARGALRKLGRIPSTVSYFSPKGGCQDAIVKELKSARREILVQAYSFTADPLTYGLIEAKKRGVTVEILLDKSNEAESYSDLKIFLDNGLPPLIDASHAIAHNKIIVIDKQIVITGSYNFTNQAETQNAENLLIIKGNPDLVQSYRQNFLAHKAHSKAAELKAPAENNRFGNKPKAA